MAQKMILAYDRKIKKKVLHKIVDGWAISVITGSRFKYDPSKGK